MSAIGSAAENKFWLRVGFTHLKSDIDLLPIFQREVNRPDNRPKLIVLHINGSHPQVCNYAVPESYKWRMHDSYYKEAFCYVESIRQTDEFLSFVYDTLKASGQSFSMIYFADHGLSHSEVGGQLVLKHANPSAQCRDIPLFMTSSEDKERRVVKGRRLARRFVEGAAHWLGIKTRQLPSPRGLFDPEIDPDREWEGHEQLMRSRRQDPAVNILEH